MLLVGLAVQGALVNPGFEDGTLTGWEADFLPGDLTASIGVVPSYNGNFSLNPFFVNSGNNGGTKFVTIAPNLAVPGLQGIHTAPDGGSVFVGAGQSMDVWYALDQSSGDGISIRIEARDPVSAEVLDFYETPAGELGESVATWTPWTYTSVLGGDTVFSFQVLSIDGGSGTAMFDINAVPEAKGWMMGGALVGILGASSLLRRRQAKATA